MNTNGRARTTEPSVANSFADLTHDVIELAELQSQLFMCDIKKTSQNARTAFVLCGVGLCLLLGCVPVALIALAEVLQSQLNWSSAVSYSVSTIVGLLCSAAVMALGYARFKTGLGTLERSREELRRNIAWVKSSLRNRAPSNPEPHVTDRY